MDDNSEIDYYINNIIENKNKDEILEEEIENIFNNMLNETPCYIFFDIPPIQYSIVGLGINLSYIDTTFLIPNLFRLCYSQNSAVVPYIGPIYINSINTVNYFPLLIDVNFIKSFLYFNFPGAIKNFNNNFDFINSIYSYKNLNKKYTTYASFTSPIDIILNTYSSNSLLIQLIKFSNYITNAYYTYNNNLLLNDFIIGWDFTQSCITFNNIDIFTTGNYTAGINIITQNIAYNIYYSYFGTLYYNNGRSNLNNETNPFITTQKYSIYTILQITMEVFNDITSEIKCYFENKTYCKKSYMYAYNIPILLKIYKNYYNNQIYTISKNYSINNRVKVTPTVIFIQDYVNKFISVYYSTYPNRYLIKTLYLNDGKDALIFFNSLGNNWSTAPEYTPISYWYYYINIGNPSPVELYNINNIVNGTYTTLVGTGSFSDAYNTLYNTNNSYYISNTITYVNYGLYPDSGILYESGSLDPLYIDPNLLYFYTFSATHLNDGYVKNLATNNYDLLIDSNVTIENTLNTSYTDSQTTVVTGGTTIEGVSVGSTTTIIPPTMQGATIKTNDFSLNSNYFTISFMFKTNSSYTTKTIIFSLNMDPSNSYNNNNIYIYIMDASSSSYHTLYFCINNDSNIFFLTRKNTQYFISWTITKDNNGSALWIIYINDVKKIYTKTANNAVFPSILTVKSGYIGKYPTNTENYKGTIDNFFIYNNILSDDQIINIYKKRLSGLIGIDTSLNIPIKYYLNIPIQYFTYNGYTNINGIVYYFNDSNNKLQSILFETLQSPKTLINGQNDDTTPVPGIVLQYYKNI